MSATSLTWGGRSVPGPGGLPVIVLGKFLFLLGQGVVQAGLIFAAAALLHGVDVSGHWFGWIVTSIWSWRLSLV